MPEWGPPASQASEAGWGPPIAAPAQPKSVFEDIPAADAAPSPMAAPKSGWGAPISTEKKPDESPGYLEALGHGIWDAGVEGGQSAQAIGGNKIDEATQRPEGAPLKWSDAASPVSKLGPKMAYRLAKSAPVIAGGVVGGAFGTAVAPGVGTVLGGAIGAAAVSAYQTIGPTFQEELKKSPDDPDGAWNRTLQNAAISGLFSGASWAAFPAKFFEGPVKNLAFQALGIQPGIAVGEQATKNVVNDKPITENLGQAYAEGAAGTATPLAGHAILKGGMGAFAPKETRSAGDMLDQASKLEKTAADPNLPPELKDQFTQQADALRNQATAMGPEPQAATMIQKIKSKVDDFMDGAVGDIVQDAQMKMTPMAARNASAEARAVAKDFANEKRVSLYTWSKVDEHLKNNLTEEQRQRMWNAADEESVALQQGKSTEGIGLSRLSPQERSIVDLLQKQSQAVWQAATDLGMVKGEGLPSYTPRLFIGAADSLGSKNIDPFGRNLSTSTPNMKKRSYLTAAETEAAGKAKMGDDASLVRDIRALPLATARLQDAVAGRTLINKVKEIGKNTGQDTVAEGSKPEDGHKWFTIEQNPAFSTIKPRMDPTTGRPLMDANGKVVYDRTPLYVRDDFEGPLRSVLTRDQGKIYSGMMQLKAKTMSVIMYSPLIHNAVEWGRALPAMPGKVLTSRVYFEGNAARKGYNYDGTLKYIKDAVTGKRTLKEEPSEVMQEAISNGLVPIGHRGGMQDITSMMEEPSLAAGRSLTSKVLAAGPGLVSERAGQAVKRGVDKAGDFWHNTMLWDRVADLQMGLYVNFKKAMIKDGIDDQSASRAAAHLANRYAGALPAEAMSSMARKMANLGMFSRTFTLGNIGAMKDMFVGLPKDVQAQILRDAGPEGLGKVKSYAQKKAIATMIMDVGLMYASNSLLQDASDKIRGEKTWGDIGQGYIDRFAALMKRTKEHPFEVLTSIPSSIQSLSSTSENEPGLEDRVLVGYQDDGTAIYARNPTGKIGEEIKGYMTSPFDMVHRKLSTYARPLSQIYSNDKGFGRKVYNPDAKTTAEQFDNVKNIVKLLVTSQLPMDQLEALGDLYTGGQDKTMSTLKLLGPLAGLTFRKGAPGGPAQGELYAAENKQKYIEQQAMPDIRKMIRSGNADSAREKMTSIGIAPSKQNFIIRSTLNPQISQRRMTEFNRRASEEEKERMARARSKRNME